MAPTQNSFLVEKQAYKLMELQPSTFKLFKQQRVFLWRCLLGVLLTGQNLQKRLIASPHCTQCDGRSEIVSHLLWTCSLTTTFVPNLSVSLSHRFLGQRFGKYFWLFGQILCTLSSNAYFLQWTRFWALWAIWTARNNKIFD